MIASPVARVVLLLAGALAQAPSADKAAYPNAALLIEAAELKKLHPPKDCIVLDTRPTREYLTGNVPHSLNLDVNTWAKAFETQRNPADWSERLGKLGIDTKTRVIILGNSLPDVARVWFILRYWGVEQVQILNGGYPAWVNAGGEVSRQGWSVAARAGVKLKEDPSRLATKESVLAMLKLEAGKIVDARTRAEYCGEKALAKRGGAIPKAAHLDWSNLVDAKTGRFKSPQELAKLFKDAGVDLDKPVVTYCQSGGRASVMAFALELMGGKQVQNYYRSWAEWGNAADTPVEKPK